MNEKVIVPFQEIVSVDSIDALVGLYTKRGYNFIDEKSFLNILSGDWRRELARLNKEAQSFEVPSEFPSIEVKINGVTYGIHGVVHDATVLAPKYIELISDALGHYPNWICENWISNSIQIQNKAVEIPDFSANGNWAEFRFCVLLGLFFPGRLVQTAYDSINKSRLIQEVLSELNIPLEAKGELPAYVEIELREKKGKPYTHEQPRSAYHAEFLKAWKKGEDKGDFIGRYHVAEIKRFLTKGVKDSRIVDLANNHAELLENDPEKFLELKNKIDNRATVMQAAGVLAGASLYAFGITKILI